jgi:hypothetical protein
MFSLLAHNYGRIPEYKFPSRLNDDKIAGIGLLQGFMKRHKNRKLCKPENTSLFMATAFNKTNGMEFFDNYECALKSWEFTAGRAYNIDEAGVSTIVKQECPPLYGHLILLLSLRQNRLDKLFQVIKEL